ncbi:disease resistance-like protein DSC1 [Senna tora]|uniref:Disease resistance-like protein DSC1 n=1 Tax=Senna tora TaxID=362788 RepID=A0A835CHR8_9FABA|nr:disease resistance-like protein DSC1 [Senna tora]
MKKINLFGSEHLISLPDLSHAPNIECVDVGKCRNLAEIHSSTFLPKLKKLLLLRSKTPRFVNIGSKIDGNLGFVAVYNILDVVDMSLHKVSIKVFISDDATQTCGFEVKGVSVPFTSNISECTSLLPFVSKVYLLDIRESENFKKHFGTFLGRFEMLVFKYDELTIPKSINRWSLLTHLRLQKRDTIPAGFSTLKSLAETNCSSSIIIQPITNLTFSRNITGRFTLVDFKFNWLQ